MFLSSYLLESPGEVVESLSLEVSKKRLCAMPLETFGKAPNMGRA